MGTRLEGRGQHDLGISEQSLADFQHDLAELSAAFHQPVRIRRLGQGESAMNLRGQPVMRDKPEQRVEFTRAAHGRADNMHLLEEGLAQVEHHLVL